MTEFAGRGDPRRSMELLWGVGEAPSRGPKPGLSATAIAQAAIELADAEGLDAVSMRKVGERLGKSAMSLYTYVPSKAELIDVMLDTVLGELPTSYRLDDGWRAAVETAARDGWAFYERHPWVLQISGSRATLGPHELDVYESQLQIFDGLGLNGLDITRVVGVIGSFVRGAAKALSDARTSEQATGLSDDEWWNARAPILEELMVGWEERYPMATRLSAEASFDEPYVGGDASYTVLIALDQFEFGLQRMLDGIEVFIATR